MKKVFALLLLTCFSVYLVSPGMCEVLVVDVKKVNQNKNRSNSKSSLELAFPQIKTAHLWLMSPDSKEFPCAFSGMV